MLIEVTLALKHTCAEVIQGGDGGDKLATEAWAGAVDVLQGGN